MIILVGIEVAYDFRSIQRGFLRFHVLPPELKSSAEQLEAADELSGSEAVLQLAREGMGSYRHDVAAPALGKMAEAGIHVPGTTSLRQKSAQMREVLHGEECHDERALIIARCPYLSGFRARIVLVDH